MSSLVGRLMDRVTTKICIDFPERGRHMCRKRHTMPRRGERLYPCPLYTPEGIHERSPVVLREKLHGSGARYVLQGPLGIGPRTLRTLLFHRIIALAACGCTLLCPHFLQEGCSFATLPQSYNFSIVRPLGGQNRSALLSALVSWIGCLEQRFFRSVRV